MDGEQRGKPSRRRTNAKKGRLYQSVSDSLRRRLVEGNLPAGSKLPPLRQLASQFNVSTITIRQALRMLEREGHLHCIAGVGVFVRPTIPSRPATEQITVAFATIEIETAHTNELAHHIEEACQGRGWTMQLLNARGDPQVEARNLIRLGRCGASGAIILPGGHPENFEAMVELKLSGFPFVQVDRWVPGLKVDIVESNHEKGAYLATQHLIEHGHRRVLMVCQMSALTPVLARIRGYERALADHGIEPLRAWRIWMDDEITARGGREGYRCLGGYAATRPVLAALTPPVAVFAHNAYSGWGVFEACRELGLNVPRDVSIVCFDDSEFTRALSPPMTAIRQRTDELARIALELLDRRLSTTERSDPQHIEVDVDIIERGSVATVG